MTSLPPLVVCLPLAVAAMLVALQRVLGRRGAEALALVATLGTLAATIVLFAAVANGGPTIVWLGGWHPGTVVGLGIAFDVDLASASIAVLVATIVTAAIVFSRQYFDDVGTIFYVLLLAMLGAMIAFSYTADAFDLFVFYEMFSVAAYALSAYHVERKSSFEGALQFALTNSVAGLFILIALILLEGRTGHLDLAAIGRGLAGQHGGDALAGTSLAFLSVGLFTRGALAPLHFWFDEVHASAPTPLCVVLSGAMAPIALYGFARFYWVAYAPVLPPGPALAGSLCAIGALSAIVGSIMCLRSQRLKRALAFSTVAHAGVVVAALGAFDAGALAGAALYAAAYALGTAALFMAVAILRAHGDGEVTLLHSVGIGRRLPLTGAVFALGTVDLAGVWFGTEPFANARVAFALAILVGIATGGAFVRALWRLFVTRTACSTRPRDVPWFLIGPAFALAAIPAVLALVPYAHRIAALAATAVVDGDGYARALLANAAPVATRAAVTSASPLVVLAPLGALALGASLVSSARPLRAIRVTLARSAPVVALRRTHDGNSGRYVGWIVATAIAASTLCSSAAR